MFIYMRNLNAHSIKLSIYSMSDLNNLKPYFEFVNVYCCSQKCMKSDFLFNDLY